MPGRHAELRHTEGAEFRGSGQKLVPSAMFHGLPAGVDPRPLFGMLPRPNQRSSASGNFALAVRRFF
jgi:hypothetical protein